jgi:hypothetical protein
MLDLIDTIMDRTPAPVGDVLMYFGLWGGLAIGMILLWHAWQAWRHRRRPP